MRPLTLFIVKKSYHYEGEQQVSSGLRTSARFIVDMLCAQGYNAKLVEAIDGNSIDRLVAENGPSRVVIEAIWVTPQKMAELQRLWPDVSWTVRVHSEIAFLSNEGNAIAWLAAYVNQGIEVAFNSEQAGEDFSFVFGVGYLPNYYPRRNPRVKSPASGTVNVGCFGAIRPLKNQLIQAFAAIAYADKNEKNLVFHVNGSRIEQSGSSNLRNIEALFSASGHTLVLHPWMRHEDFLRLVAVMDICMAVSLSETFCITAADAVSLSVPLVGSKAISWLPSESQAPVDSVAGIAETMEGITSHHAVERNLHALDKFSKKSVLAWRDWVKS